MKKITIQTAQNVEIEYEVAGLANRFMAALLDYLILFTYIFFATLLVGLLSINNSSSTFIMSLYTLLVGIPYMAYHLVCEVFFEGQSFGKRQMDIKVIHLEGAQVGIGNYIIRWLFRIIDINLTFGGLAIATIIFNGKGQRLGDIAANTLVISLKNTTKLSDTIFVNKSKITDENYQVTFPQVQDLSDQDIGLVKEILDTAVRTQHHRTALILVKHMQKLLQVTTLEMPPRKFLATIIKDYYHLNS